jgi:2-polyprenyl-6-methoxyphenol hydroxylase-like FAD-dependent oxidoreductase
MTLAPSAARAVVIGAGFAGLMTAALLARHFAHVCVVDRDDTSAAPGLRKGVPQAAHVHALLQSGRQVLSRFFPNFEQKALAAGSLKLNVRTQWRTFAGTRWMDPTDTGLHILSQTRPLLEQLIRREVFAMPTVQSLRAKVTGLRVNDQGAVSGIWLNMGAGDESLTADFVVDASGRAGQTDRWLSAVGCAPPPTQVALPDVRYVSALFTRSVSRGPDLAGWLNFASAPETRGGILAPVEDDRWIVTATCRFGEAAPSDEGVFRAFLDRLRGRKIGGLLARERLKSGFATYRIAATYFRRFDLIEHRLPAGYVPIGDALATFNPIYGQGMSVAALQAEALQQVLASLGFAEGWRDRAAELYLARAMKPARWAWLLGQAADMEYPQYKGERSEEVTLLNRALRRAITLSIGRPQFMGHIDHMLHLLVPPESLYDIAAVSEALRPRDCTAHTVPIGQERITP